MCCKFAIKCILKRKKTSGRTFTCIVDGIVCVVSEVVIADVAVRHQLFDAVQRRADDLGGLALAGQLEGQEEGLNLNAGRVQLGQDCRRLGRFVATA